MKKNRIQKIEEEINVLTKKRADLFNEWAYLVKKNDRELEMNGKNNPKSVQKAEFLLKEQKAISKKIMKLLEKADSLAADLE